MLSPLNIHSYLQVMHPFLDRRLLSMPELLDVSLMFFPSCRIEKGEDKVLGNKLIFDREFWFIGFTAGAHAKMKWSGLDQAAGFAKTCISWSHPTGKVLTRGKSERMSRTVPHYQLHMTRNLHGPGFACWLQGCWVVFAICLLRDTLKNRIFLVATP